MYASRSHISPKLCNAKFVCTISQYVFISRASGYPTHYTFSVRQTHQGWVNHNSSWSHIQPEAHVFCSHFRVLFYSSALSRTYYAFSTLSTGVRLVKHNSTLFHISQKKTIFFCVFHNIVFFDHTRLLTANSQSGRQMRRLWSTNPPNPTCNAKRTSSSWISYYWFLRRFPPFPLRIVNHACRWVMGEAQLHRFHISQINCDAHISKHIISNAISIPSHTQARREIRKEGSTTPPSANFQHTVRLFVHVIFWRMTIAWFLILTRGPGMYWQDKEK